MKTTTVEVCSGAFTGQYTGEVQNCQGKMLTDPTFILGVEYLGLRQRQWERQRAYWPADIDRRAAAWRAALAEAPIGEAPTSRGGR